jgi:hypothetical protein
MSLKEGANNLTRVIKKHGGVSNENFTKYMPFGIDGVNVF